MNIKSLVVASAITGILSTSLLSMSAFGETYDQCVNRKKAERSSQTVPFVAENVARCFSCKLCWFGEKPEERSAQVVYDAPPGYTILRNVVLIDKGSANHGFVGPINYQMDENGRVYRVYVDMWCRSDNAPFGAGAWRHRGLTGKIQKMGITAEDVLSITQECAQLIGQ